MQMKSLYIKAKYYYCHFYSHSMCLCLEHSTASALIFNTNRNKNQDTPKRLPAYAILYEIMVVGKRHWQQSQFDPSGDSSLAVTLWPWLMGTCSLVPGQTVEEKTLFPSIKLLV